MKKINPLLLLVEDDPQFQMLLSTTLESQDYRVLAAATGQDGLITARNH
jgi:CheY-like chemotaxis protein